MIQKSKKIRTKFTWFTNYFMNSTIAIYPCGRKTRKVYPRVKRDISKKRNDSLPPTHKSPTYLMNKKRGKFRGLKRVNKGLLAAPSRPTNRGHDPNEQKNASPQYKAPDKNRDMPPTPPNASHAASNSPKEMGSDGSTPEECTEHVRDKIKALLDRTTTLAATDHNSDAHRKEIYAINEEIKLVEQHLQEIVQTQSATSGSHEPTGRGPMGLKEMLEYMPPDFRLNQMQAKTLKEAVDTIKRLLPMFAAEVREYAGMCGETEDICAYSHGLAFQLFKLSGAHFPETTGQVYLKTITRATSDYTSHGQETSPCDYTVTLIDYGAELYHYAIRDGVAGHPENMQPMATAITHTLTVQVNKRFIILDEEKKDLISMLLMEPARCFFIALGRATNQNPVLLQSAFRARAQEFAGHNPHTLRMGSLTRDPLLSLLRYGEYVDHTILLTIFPESLMDHRIVVYTCSWGPEASPNVINAVSYQAKGTNPTKVATIFLHANHHYTNILDNSELVRIPVIMAIPLETPDTEITILKYTPVNSSPMPITISPYMRDKIREESSKTSELVQGAKYSQTLANIMATRATRVWNLTEDLQQHLSDGDGPKHIDLGYNLHGTAELQGRCNLTQKNPWTEPPDSDIQELLSHFDTNNRCFVIHLAAALGLNPLHLENLMVIEAIRLLDRTDLHPTEAKVLASILEYDGSPNANVLALVYPEIIKHAIVRVVVLKDNISVGVGFSEASSRRGRSSFAVDGRTNGSFVRRAKEHLPFFLSFSSLPNCPKVSRSCECSTVGKRPGEVDP